MKFVPEDVLPAEWEAFKKTQLEPSAIPQKYKD